MSTNKPAAPNTLAEVLTIDDDDANLTNGTRNFSIICSIFEDRLITSGTYPCGDSAGSASVVLPDCDESGSLDIFDFFCFSNLFAAGVVEADTDRNGVLDTHDYAAFQVLYENTYHTTDGR